MKNRRLLLMFLLAGLVFAFAQGCGEESGSAGDYTATMTGAFALSAAGSAELRTNGILPGSFVIQLGPESDFSSGVDLNGMELRLEHIEGRPMVGTYSLDEEVEDTAGILRTTDGPSLFYYNDTLHVFRVIPGQLVEITSSSEDQVEGNFTIDVEVRGPDPENQAWQPAVISAEFSAR